MSIKVMDRVWLHGPDDRTELLVLLAFADFANDAGECWPSMETVAQKARMSARGVRKVVRRLEVLGYLTVDVGGGRSGCSNYTVNPERHSGNVVPVKPINPEPGSPPPGTGVHKTRNSGSAEPSRTVNEPSPLTPQGGMRRSFGVSENVANLARSMK